MNIDQWYVIAILAPWIVALMIVAYHNRELIHHLREQVGELEERLDRLPEVTIADGTHTLSCNTIGTLHVTGGAIGWCNSEPAPTPTYMHRMTCGHDGLEVTPDETVMGARVWKCPTCGKVEENGMVP